MATRLEEAFHVLAKAMGGRPYIVVFQVTHPDARVQTIGTVRPPSQPFFITRGLLAEGSDSEAEMNRVRSKYEHRKHSTDKEEPSDDDPS